MWVTVVCGAVREPLLDQHTLQTTATPQIMAQTFLWSSVLVVLWKAWDVTENYDRSHCSTLARLAKRSPSSVLATDEAMYTPSTTSQTVLVRIRMTSGDRASKTRLRGLIFGVQMHIKQRNRPFEEEMPCEKKENRKVWYSAFHSLTITDMMDGGVCK